MADAVTYLSPKPFERPPSQAMGTPELISRPANKLRSTPPMFVKSPPTHTMPPDTVMVWIDAGFEQFAQRLSGLGFHAVGTPPPSIAARLLRAWPPTDVKTPPA